MARLARAVVPGFPHHITQRGNRRQRTFFNDDDYRAYLELMREWCDACGVAIWAYCLMPDHVHLVAVPETADGLRRGIGEAHRRYSRRVNVREGWVGHLWQGRFASCVMDEAHLLAAVRYVEMNPVRARLHRKPWRYKWSSAAAHVAGRDDALVQVAPMLEMVADRMADLPGRQAGWKAYLALETPPETVARLRLHEGTGRPLGDGDFVHRMEKLLGRQLTPNKPGPKPKKPKRKRKREPLN
ncbi:MAG TPA: transposase [Phycisphaerae bacterium]|nr:transposase [Phycisphaerae bacterium]